MKPYFRFILLYFIPLLIVGCRTDKDNPEMPNYNNADYYIKYEATVNSIYTGNNIKYIVNTDKGFQTFTNGKSFSQTFGPVKKGFHAKITADASSWYQADCDVKIYVCRGSEPFSLKAHNSGGKKVYVTYLIDY